MIYAEQLVKEGFTKERAESISQALDTLHGSLSALDFESVNRFFTVPLETRLSNFAKAEGVRDVTKDKR
jgi:hypothetical protein